MSQVEALLQERMQKKERHKMTALAERAAEGRLSSFGGLFAVSALDSVEVERLRALLATYAQEENTPAQDLEPLLALTAEVRALNHQAALLHGERIQKVHALLKGYREGAFTAWLIAIYGNRQTPYNLWRYYEFYNLLPKQQRPLLEQMPRQAIYTLSTREGSFERKQQFILDYKGQTKHELLTRIRAEFPLPLRDGRSSVPAVKLLKALEESLVSLKLLQGSLSESDALRVARLLSLMQQMLVSRS